MTRLVLCALATACSATNGADDVDVARVEPASAHSAQPVPLVIEGTGFELRLVNDLDTGDTTVETLVARVGDTPLDAVRVQTDLQLEAVVPAGLEPGTYDVIVEIGTRRDRLADGYTVLPPDVIPPPPPCVPGFVDVCAVPVPTTDLEITVSETIDTDTDPRCITLQQPNGGPICLIYATAVTIGSGATLTATGSRPLAIAATSAMTIDGTIDVSSQRGVARGPGADDAACTFASVPENDLGGAAGGAGGSFGTSGGNGGVGDTDNSLGGDGQAVAGTAGAAATITSLRGGCHGQTGGAESVSGGQGGTGGSGGGALYLYAPDALTLGSPGRIRATGAGGAGGQVQAGGGGGGSGGLVIIESEVITIAGAISANGGGAGAGGSRTNGTPVTGPPGADGSFGTTPAVGGSNAIAGGNGGTGGAGTTPPAAGSSSIVGGGGGGGAVGIVRLIGTTIVSPGDISPPPQ